MSIFRRFGIQANAGTSNPAAFRIAISPSSASLEQGGNQEFTATMTLRSGDPEIVTTADVTGLPTGVTKIGAITFGTVSGFNADGSDTVTLTGGALSYAVGQTLGFIGDSSRTVASVPDDTHLVLNDVVSAGAYDVELVTLSTAQVFYFTLIAANNAEPVVNNSFDVTITAPSGTRTKRGTVTVEESSLFSIAITGDADTMNRGTASSFTVTLSTINAPLTTTDIYLSGLPTGVSTQYVKNNAAATAGSGAPFSEARNREISTDGGSVTVFISAHGAAALGASSFTVHVVTEQETITATASVTVAAGSPTLVSTTLAKYSTKAAAQTGTDISVGLQALIDGLSAGQTLVLDGWARVSKTIYKPEDVNFVGIGMDASGLWWSNDSNCQLFGNSGQDASDGSTATGVGRWADMELDGNETNQTKYEAGVGAGSNTPNGNGFVTGAWFAGCTTQTVANVRVRNSKTFAWIFSNVTDSFFHNIETQFDEAAENGTFENKNQDTFHWFGMKNCVLSGLRTNGGDDVLALNTTEGVYVRESLEYNYTGFLPARYPNIAAGGDILNVLIEDVWLQNVWSTCRMISYDDVYEPDPENNPGVFERTNVPLASDTIKNVVIRNVRGSAIGDGTQGSSWYDGTFLCPTMHSVTIDGWAVTGSSSNIRLVGFTPTIDIEPTPAPVFTLNNISTNIQANPTTGIKVEVDPAYLAGNYETDGLVPLEFARYKLADRTDWLGEYDLTDNGTVTFATGKIGNAAVFNGTSQYLTSTASPKLQTALTDDFTVSFWIKWSAPVLSRVIGQWSETSANNRWIIYIDGSGNLGVVVATSGTYAQANSTAPLASAPWHFVTLTWNNTTFDARLRINADAWLNNNTTNGTAPMLTTGTTDGFAIGAGIDGAYKFAGMVDAVRVYAGILSDAEVTALYNAGTGTEG